jgi:hypothetical protein
MEDTMAIARLIVGGIALITGRRLYWFFVAAAGFVAGLTLANRFFEGESELLIIVIALAAGLIGAVLALFLQRVAVAVAGFILAGYVVTALLALFNLDFGQLDWILYLVAGVFGAILVSVLFDWALIILSSLAGGVLIVQVFDLQSWITAVLLLGLLVLGITIQAAQLPGSSAQERKR